MTNFFIFKRMLMIFPVLLLLAVASRAHSPGESYVVLKLLPQGIEGRAELGRPELESVFGLQWRENPQECIAELNQHAGKIRAYLRERLVLSGDEQTFSLNFTTNNVLNEVTGLGVFHFRVDSGPLPETLHIRQDLFFDAAPRHRSLLVVEHNHRTEQSFNEGHTALIFTPGRIEQSLDLTRLPELMNGWQFVEQGAWHIWIGIDHILFLLALLFPSVLRRVNGTWQPVDSFGRALFNVLRIVTLFTLAHSITLVLAALEFVQLPSRLVESIIALSIVVVALNNIFPAFNEKSWVLIVLFGLFHGMGFASVMGELPFRMEELLTVTLFFNLGVELGQIAIVAVVFPVLFLLRPHKHYPVIVLRLASIILALIAFWWLLERSLDL